MSEQLSINNGRFSATANWQEEKSQYLLSITDLRKNSVIREEMFFSKIEILTFHPRRKRFLVLVCADIVKVYDLLADKLLYEKNIDIPITDVDFKPGLKNQLFHLYFHIPFRGDSYMLIPILKTV